MIICYIYTEVNSDEGTEDNENEIVVQNEQKDLEPDELLISEVRKRPALYDFSFYPFKSATGKKLKICGQKLQ